MGVIDKAIAGSVTVIPRPIVKKISSRYIAGDRLDDAIAVIKDLNRDGCVATVDVLGEGTDSKSDAAGKLEEYKEVIDALDEHNLDSGLSVKLTGLGLTVDENLCRTNLEEVVEYAAERDRFVRIDMEDSPYTAATVQIAIDMHERHENVGDRHSGLHASQPQRRPAARRGRRNCEALQRYLRRATQHRL